MKHLIFIAIVTFVFYSCDTNHSKRKKYYEDLLQPVDKINLLCFSKVDTSTYSIVDKKGIEIFKKIINGRNESIQNSDTYGQILFYAKGRKIFSSSMLNAGVKYQYQGNTIKSRVTYQAGQYFEQACSKNIGN